MNNVSTLRHSRAHRDAAKRNAKALATRFVTRVTIETSEKAAYRLLMFGLPAGVRLVGQFKAAYGTINVFIFVIDAGCSFAFDPRSPYFQITNTERVRK